MVIFERSVTKEFWSATHDYIMRRIHSDRYHRVGHTSVFHVHGADTTRTYVIMQDGAPIAWLCLARRQNWKAWEVRQVFTFPAFRGQGLALQLYKAAINVDKILLAAGKTQSKSSRALWRRFVSTGAFNIWAQDFNDLSKRAGVEVHDDELYCALDVYTKDFCSQDVRLLAVRK